jgi:hypothetical protein
MVATKPRVRASTGVARELGASAMHRWEDYVACGAPQRARRSAMGGLSPQTFQGYRSRIETHFTALLLRRKYFTGKCKRSS